MRSNRIRFITCFLSPFILSALLSCATEKAPLQIKNSLPQSELEYYNDSFDKMREDLWDRAGYLSKKAQMQNFQQADMQFVNGKLVIRTKTGSFSKGGLGSKFAIRGDFDIQLDCRIDFLRGISGMDQISILLVLDKRQEVEKADLVLINLAMEGGSHQARIGSNGFLNRRSIKGGVSKIGNFNGTLRFIRNGKYISTFYKNKGASDWEKMYTFRATDKDMIIGFQLGNFFSKRTSIRAQHSISAEFDNFRINAAHAIIEDEI